MTRLRGGAETRPSGGILLPAESRRPPSSPKGTFEFVHIIGSEMCAAEDIFLRGQLLPYKPPPACTRSPTQPPPTASSHGLEYRRCPSDQARHRGQHRRAESLDRYERGGGAASRYWNTRGSHSADYQRLRPVAEEACDARAAGPRAGVSTSSRPKWYVLMFGSVKVPSEMDMNSIRSRLRRRSTSGADAGRVESLGGVKTGGAGGGGGAWKLLRSLSCKGDVGGVVESPIRSYALT